MARDEKLSASQQTRIRTKSQIRLLHLHVLVYDWLAGAATCLCDISFGYRPSAWRHTSRGGRPDGLIDVPRATLSLQIDNSSYHNQFGHRASRTLDTPDPTGNRTPSMAPECRRKSALGCRFFRAGGEKETCDRRIEMELSRLQRYRVTRPVAKCITSRRCWYLSAIVLTWNLSLEWRRLNEAESDKADDISDDKCPSTDDSAEHRLLASTDTLHPHCPTCVCVCACVCVCVFYATHGYSKVTRRTENSKPVDEFIMDKKHYCVCMCNSGKEMVTGPRKILKVTL